MRIARVKGSHDKSDKWAEFKAMAKLPAGFDRMDVADLVELRDAVVKALERKITAERQELEKKLGELSLLQNGKAHRSRLAAKATAPAKKAHPLKGRKAAAKYKGPNGESWSGRGLTPRWLSALENKGKKRAAFLIA